MAAGKPAVLQIDIRADDNHAKAALSGFSSFTTGITAGIAAGVTGAVTNVLGNLGSMILDFGTDVINAGFAADDAMDHLVRVFQDGAQDIILAWAGIAPQTFGVTASEFEEGATQLGRVLTNMGADQTTAANLVVQTAQMAADLAETYGLTWGDAFSALEGVALGKFKSISKFTGTFTDEMIAQTEAALAFAGGDKTGAELAVARLQTAFGLLGGVSGAFKDDLNDVDGAVANMNVQFDQFKEQLGTELLPVLAEMLPTVKQLFQIFVDNKDTILEVARLSIMGIAGLDIAIGALKFSLSLLAAAWDFAARAVALAVQLILLGFRFVLMAASQAAGAIAFVADVVRAAWNAMYAHVVAVANAIIGIVVRVVSAIQTLLRSIPGAGLAGSIIGALNPFGRSVAPEASEGLSATPTALDFAPTATAGVSFGTPISPLEGAAAGGLVANVFGAVTGDQIVSALARYTKNTASLAAAGVRIS